jgi:hypothetical protein
MPCIKVRKRMLKWDKKKGTLSEIYQLYPRKMICKNGKRTVSLAMDKDGL